MSASEKQYASSLLIIDDTSLGLTLFFSSILDAIKQSGIKNE
jgi:hypothetical protein